jgi:hypothetical protein
MQPLINKKSKRLVLTSVNQVITLAKGNPQLVEQMPKLEGLTTLPLSSAPKKSCNCGGKINFTTEDEGKQTTESILSSLVSSDFLQIKNILGLDELCYYNRSPELNSLEMICV